MVEESSYQETLRGFALDLVKREYIEQEVAQEALLKAAKRHIPFVYYLAQEELISSTELAIAAAKYFGLPILDLKAINSTEIPFYLVEKLTKAQKKYALPLFRRGERLYIAVADPTIYVLQEIQFNTKLTVIPILVEVNKLTELVELISETREMAALTEVTDADLDELVVTVEEEKEEDKISELDIEDAPIVRFVNKILLDAIREKASDIHFEPYENIYRVRYRIDGILYEIAKPPFTFARRVSARIKVMSQLNIAETRIPQDGRFKLNLTHARSIDFRVSTCPVVAGEKVVVRLLDPASAHVGVSELGMSDAQREQFFEVVNYPQGMILVTGPTGSGKTVTLYTALNALNNTERNISTAENPVEINVKGINQVNVHPAIGLTFAACLRSFLRQDPDVIMIGEIRDLETAEIAIKAAQTGHLVLSTLHTNGAVETLTRLLDMGVERFDIATSVTIVVAQRLARRLCKTCRREIQIPEVSLIKEGFSKEEIPELKLYEPVGCDNCRNGYKGRTGIYEVVYMSKNLKQAILRGANAIELQDLALSEGAMLLRTSGLEKVRQGIISLAELNRVIKV